MDCIPGSRRVAVGGACSHADDGGLYAQAHRWHAEGRPLAADVHGLRALVSVAPVEHHGRSDLVLLRLGVADPAAADRLHTTRRQLADPGLFGAAAWRNAASDRSRSRAGAAAGSRRRACEEYLHHGRWRQRGRRPVRDAGRRRGAQGDAHGPARRAQPAATQAGNRKCDPCGARGLAGRSQPGRARRLRRKIRSGAHCRGPAGAAGRRAGR